MQTWPRAWHTAGPFDCVLHHLYRVLSCCWGKKPWFSPLMPLISPGLPPPRREKHPHLESPSTPEGMTKHKSPESLLPNSLGGLEVFSVLHPNLSIHWLFPHVLTMHCPLLTPCCYTQDAENTSPSRSWRNLLSKNTLGNCCIVWLLCSLKYLSLIWEALPAFLASRV